ncbi:uncharacterized protein METZ01_LOCUS364239 [marine metagenome]|uniref:Uncharacterized protein n=1 Tax=marine metagenome TaxID=408172 RepID=A0A382SPJ8_9ZZZZ
MFENISVKSKRITNLQNSLNKPKSTYGK